MSCSGFSGLRQRQRTCLSLRPRTPLRLQCPHFPSILCSNSRCTNRILKDKVVLAPSTVQPSLKVVVLRSARDGTNYPTELGSDGVLSLPKRAYLSTQEAQQVLYSSRASKLCTANATFRACGEGLRIWRYGSQPQSLMLRPMEKRYLTSRHWTLPQCVRHNVSIVS